MTLAAVAFGGNVGRPDLAFRDALLRLDGSGGLRLRSRSSLWRSAPWGFTEQPEFLNGAAVFETDLSPGMLLELLQECEASAGRTAGERWGPRVLDLDLLWSAAEIRRGPGLTLPHPAIAERTFVLEPLREVAPGWVHPIAGKTCGELLADLQSSGRATPCAVLHGVRLGEEAETGACPR